MGTPPRARRRLPSRRRSNGAPGAHGFEGKGHMVAKARMRYLGSSAQKTRLVIDQIRGMGVNEAIATLRESPKAVARDIVKVLRSAVANAESGDQRIDADTLF